MQSTLDEKVIALAAKAKARRAANKRLPSLPRRVLLEAWWLCPDRLRRSAVILPFRQPRPSRPQRGR
jgi:hypothetical protein